MAEEEEEQEEDEDDDDDDDDEEEEAESDSEAHTGLNSESENPRVDHAARAAAEPSELMQLEMSEDIRLGSPDDGSNHLDPDFQLMVASQGGVGNPVDHPPQVESFRAKSARRWPLLQDPLGGSLQPPTSGMAVVIFLS